MRVPLLVLAVVLAGCSSSNPLMEHNVLPADVPGQCQLADFQSDEYAFLRDEFNWTGNPGRVDDDVIQDEFSDEETQVLAHLIVAYDCTGPVDHVFSIALRYDAPPPWAEEEAGAQCDHGDEAFLMDGIYGTFFEVEGDESVFPDVVHNVASRLGIPDPCAGMAGGEG